MPRKKCDPPDQQKDTSEVPRKIARRADQPASDKLGRAQILKKYWELANLDPELTKGNITGQLKALDSLCSELGLTSTGPKTAKPDNQETSTREIYQSAWLRDSTSRSATTHQDDE